MLLKKQTVWLLTMLSLVVVLSVYYITSPENSQDNVAFVEENQKDEANTDKDEEKAEEQGEQAGEDKDAAEGEEDTKGETAETSEETTVVSSVASDELFTALRLEIEDSRNKLREDLRDMVASGDVSAKEKSEAMDKIEELTARAEREAVLETVIKSKGYGDALVRDDGNQVRITVKAKKHSAKAANEIIQIVKSELGQKNVAVEFQPEK